MISKKFGKAGEKILIEEFLQGFEVSYFILFDKNSFSILNYALDHKRAFDLNKGPNTGGMGAYSPAPLITKSLEKKIISKIIKPTLSALKRKKRPYQGFLYAGLMIYNNNPYLIEYNIRMGDPECQVILQRLKSDFLKIIKFAVDDKLNKAKIKWKNKKSMTIVLCSKGYPNNYKKNKPIENLNKIKLEKNEIIFHAGTRLMNNTILSNGGRVLNFTSSGKNFFKIRRKLIYLIKKLNWKNGFFRKDIGWREIEKNENN